MKRAHTAAQVLELEAERDRLVERVRELVRDRHWANREADRAWAREKVLVNRVKVLKAENNMLQNVMRQRAVAAHRAEELAEQESA